MANYLYSGVCNISFVLLLFQPTVNVFAQSSQKATFGFDQFEVRIMSPYQKIHVNQENIDQFKLVVRQQLESAGLEFSEDPSLLVNITVNIEQEVQTRDPVLNESPGPAYLADGSRDYGWYQVIVGIYKVGTIKIDLVQRQDMDLVWSGSRTTVLWKNKEKKIRRKINRNIGKIMRKFDASEIPT